MKKIKSVLLLLCFVSFLQAQDILPDNNLTGNIWRIWLDYNAEWENDELFLPPVNTDQLPVNEPDCGWEALESGMGKEVQIPATVEQYFWGTDGGEFGITGNYVGVSWFTTTLNIPQNWKDKRIVLNFESVRLRAEVYVNRKLAGYDIINGTPFQVDISNFVTPGEANFLAVRITDPNGNFAWRDWETYAWGEYQISPSHGFGGITGKVSLEATEKNWIDDVFVKNKPSIDEVDVEIDLRSLSAYKGGELVLVLTEKDKTDKLYTKRIKLPAFSGQKRIEESISLKNVKRWSVDEPNLYSLSVELDGNKKHNHTFKRTFGFRWFDVKDVDGQKNLYLNDKRIVLITAISWGHWPINGIFPTDELARKQIKTAKDLGLNMLNFHRGIGQTNVLNFADELGLLYYQEPGGYRPGEGDAFAMAFKREKLLRMVKRDRNHPSLVIYNMINESNRNPQENEIRDIQDAHKIDETRIITFTSTFFGKNFHDGKAPLDEAPVKMHMLPYDNQVKYFGWYDEHHAGGPGVYKDRFYKGPSDFYLGLNHPHEVIFWGEDGAVGTPPNLQLIVEALDESGIDGWDGDTYRKMYKAYKDFLVGKEFMDAFPDVKSLTTSMGEVSHYYHGRIIENIRVGNITDGYAVNGWENTKVENHSGVVDIFRNPKADPSIMAYYNQPLYIAVKLREKVVETGASVKADFFIVNEKNIKGKYKLVVDVIDEKGTVLQKTFDVNVTGGDTYGELLVSDIEIGTRSGAYTFVSAVLKKGDEIVTTGTDAIYAVELSEIHKDLSIAVLDTSGEMQRVLNQAGITGFDDINNAGMNKYNVIVAGKDLQPGLKLGQFRMNDPFMDWVAQGNTLLILNQPENWGEYLSHKEVLDYRGFREVGTNWFGGNYFVKDHPFFNGLPVNTAFNWEYQCLAGYDMHRVGLRLGNDACVVGVSADHKHELYSAVSIIQHGRGKIVLSTLDLSKAILHGDHSNVVAKQVLRNILNNSK